MTRECYPLCHEKRDFMEVHPPRSEEDFYKSYDPMIGIGTAMTLIIFFFLITVKACARYLTRKWQMYHFYRNIEKTTVSLPEAAITCESQQHMIV
ncbi:unnamed protein product [Auanema sp. JU1783]|nr:unnamed protein product [Auanema sp. JU1783]